MVAPTVRTPLVAMAAEAVRPGSAVVAGWVKLASRARTRARRVLPVVMAVTVARVVPVVLAAPEVSVAGSQRREPMVMAVPVASVAMQVPVQPVATVTPVHSVRVRTAAPAVMVATAASAVREVWAVLVAVPRATPVPMPMAALVASVVTLATVATVARV